MPRIKGFNETKSSIGAKIRTSKIHQILKIRPKAIVIGNSRPEIGLDPNHPCWPKASSPVYNTAIPGIKVYGQIRYGQHAIASGKIDLILIGLDFVDFLVAPNEKHDPREWPIALYEPMRLQTDANGQPRTAFYWERLEDQLSATLSLDALSDTITTLVRQEPGSAITRTPLGFNLGQPIFEPTIRIEGARVLFDQKNRAIGKRLSARSWSLTHGRTGWSSSFESLHRLFHQAREEGIRIIPFINPLHADFLVLIDRAGLWPLMDAWKTHVTSMAAEFGDGALWDFSGFDHYATESVDQVAAKGESLKWFWEPSHYRKALGDKMLATMLAPGCPDDDIADAFGIKVTPSTIQRHLAQQRADRDNFILSHQHHVDFLADMVAGSQLNHDAPNAEISRSF